MFKDIYKRENLIEHESPTGIPYRVNRGWYYEDGELIYGETGVTNVYEQIQAQKDSVDLHQIVQRYENGDKTALDRVQGMYLDTVDLPRNYAELYDSINKADRIFESMPAEIKEQYNNSASQFWKNYGQEDFDRLINDYRQKELAKYGITDDDPINSVEAIKAAVPAVESEVANVEKSE